MKKADVYKSLLGLGLEIGFLSITAAYIGAFIDDKYKLGGIGVVTMLGIALALWVYRIVTVLKKL